MRAKETKFILILGMCAFLPLTGQIDISSATKFRPQEKSNGGMPVTSFSVNEASLLNELEEADKHTYQNMTDHEKSFVLRLAEHIAKKTHQQAIEKYDEQLLNQEK